MGLTRTKVPELFSRLGWSVCGRHFFSSAAPRAVLATLGATSSNEVVDESAAPPILLTPQPERIAVRPLRRIELPAVMRLYEQNLAGRQGWPLRSEAYWEWLLARGACDRLFVAATGSEQTEIPKLLESIVGYAFVRQCRVVELVTAAGRDDVARHLLARVCADATEQDDWLVRCDLPPGHALHELVRESGGRLTSSLEQAGEWFMARLLDPLAALRHSAELFTARAREANLPRPLELGIDLRSAGSRREAGVVERFRLCIGRRTTRVETGGPSRHAVALRYADLAPLMLGGLAAEEMVAASRMKATTKKARQVAAAIFSKDGWWRPPLDDLLAC